LAKKKDDLCSTPHDNRLYAQSFKKGPRTTEKDGDDGRERLVRRRRKVEKYFEPPLRQ